MAEFMKSYCGTGLARYQAEYFPIEHLFVEKFTTSDKNKEASLQNEFNLQGKLDYTQIVNLRTTRTYVQEFVLPGNHHYNKLLNEHSNKLLTYFLVGDHKCSNAHERWNVGCVYGTHQYWEGKDLWKRIIRANARLFIPVEKK